MLPVAHPEVIYRPVADGAVLLHTGQEVYFGLNVVGAQIWELLPPACSTLEEVCATLGARYPDVPAPTLRADVLELLAELERSGLVVGPGTAADSRLG